MKFAFTLTFLGALAVQCANGADSVELKAGQPCSEQGMKPLESKYVPGRCESVYCNKENKIDLPKCSLPQTEPPCWAEAGVPGEPYPDCCYKIKCGPITPRPTPTPPKH